MRGRGKPFPKGHIPHNKQPVYEFTCETCGIEFTRPFWYLSKVGAPRDCGLTCHNRRVAAENKASGRTSKEHSGGWKGGVSTAYYRRLFWNDLPKACQRCDATTQLQVHHIDRVRSHNDPANLLVLCHSCHAKEHNVIVNITGSSSGDQR